MEEIFRRLTLPEIRTKHVELGIERDGFKTSSVQALGSAYPEMLDLCQQINSLQVVAADHEAALKKLSSVDNLSRWRRIAANTESYHAKVTAEATEREIERLKARLERQINFDVAEGQVLEASRLFYLLQAIDPKVASNPLLDAYLDRWLLKPSGDLDSIVAYILRHRVPPSRVAGRLAQHRLAQLPLLPILEGIHLMENTMTSLQYIADYELKLKLGSGKLVDALNVDCKILPQHILELPLFPSCFTEPGTFDNAQFVADAERILTENVEKSAETASAAEVVSLYSLLIRDCPQLATALHKTLVARLENLISQQTLEVSVPKTTPKVPLEATGPEQIVRQVRGQCGALHKPLEDIYAWQEAIAGLNAQIKVLEPLEARVPALLGVPKQLLDRLEAQKKQTVAKQVEQVALSPNYGAAVLVVTALDPESPEIPVLYGRVASDLVSRWALDTDKTRLDGFPTRGLLRSLSVLVEMMDEMVAGFVWDEEACIDLRKKAAAKLADHFEEMEFVQALFGLDEVPKPAAAKPEPGPRPLNSKPERSKKKARAGNGHEKNESKPEGTDSVAETAPEAEAAETGDAEKPKEPEVEEPEAKQPETLEPKDGPAESAVIPSCEIPAAVARVRLLLAPLAPVL